MSKRTATRPTAVSIVHRGEYFIYRLCHRSATPFPSTGSDPRRHTGYRATVMTQGQRPASAHDVTNHTPETPDRVAFYGMGHWRCFSAIPLRKANGRARRPSLRVSCHAIEKVSEFEQLTRNLR